MSDTKELLRECGMCNIKSDAVTLLSCGRCGQTFYCSKYCQKNHWRLQKTDCFTPEERTQMKAVTRQTTFKACELCSKTKISTGNSLRSCSRCMSVHYCSTECQKSDWARHKTSCVERGKTKIVLNLAQLGCLDATVKVLRRFQS